MTVDYVLVQRKFRKTTNVQAQMKAAPKPFNRDEFCSAKKAALMEVNDPVVLC